MQENKEEGYKGRVTSFYYSMVTFLKISFLHVCKIQAKRMIMSNNEIMNKNN